MNKHILLLPLVVISFSQSLRILPEITYQYESDNEQYNAKNLAIQDFGFVISCRYQQDNLQIFT